MVGGSGDAEALLMMGYKVYFPKGKTPFPAQRAVMSKALQALHKGQNALLESPTGTGKTLALLTSALAYQAARMEELQEVNKAEEEVPMEGVGGDSDAAAEEEEAAAAAAETKKKKKAKAKIPRIFFASRTHSQLAQVVDELRHCHPNYLDGIPEKGIPPLRMSILASRKHLCVNKKVMTKVKDDSASVDELCKELKEESRCSFYFGAVQLHQKMPSIFDVEDAVGMGKKHRGCAYYATKSLASEAQLVFCPYNFLVDPVVRGTAGIKLQNSIVIIDEAHNTEDVVRSATSCELDEWALASAVQQLQGFAESGQPWFQGLHAMLSGILDWLHGTGTLLFQNAGSEPEGNVWTGEEIIEMLESRANVTAETLPALQGYFERIISTETDAFADAVLSPGSQEEPSADSPTAALEPKYEESFKISAVTLRTLSALFNVLTFLFAKDMSNIRHYRMVVRQEEDQRGERRRHGNRRSKHLQLCIWCLHASVGFSDIEEQCHSVILASGTLSPLDSFAGELGTSFPVRVEASHVIQPTQLWAGAISTCNGRQLNCTYQYQDSSDLHDAVGSLLQFAAKLSPGGVLLFLPSYGLMKKIVARLAATGAARELCEMAPIFCEPKDSADLDQTLRDIQEEIHRSGKAVLIAVCRGKVSEGIDFSDAYARTVIVVGIPFPSIKDIQVKLKREHQNMLATQTTACVPGDVWYKQQAYRAINQAVGRCIRHRADFGAIIFAEPRFRGQGVQQNLSRWLRPAITGYESFEEAVLDLRAFFATNTAASSKVEPKTNGHETPSAVSPKGTILQFMSKVDKSDQPGSPPKQEPQHLAQLDVLSKLVEHLQENMGYPSLSELPTPSFIRNSVVHEADADYWCLYALEPDALMRAVQCVCREGNPAVTYEDHWSATDEILYRVFRSDNQDSTNTLLYCYATTANSDSYRELIWIPLSMVGPPPEVLQLPISPPFRREAHPDGFTTPAQKQPTKRKTRVPQSPVGLDRENINPGNKTSFEAIDQGSLEDEEDEAPREEDDDFDFFQLSKTKKCLSAEQCRKRKGRR